MEEEKIKKNLINIFVEESTFFLNRGWFMLLVLNNESNRRSRSLYEKDEEMIVFSDYLLI